MPWSWSLTALGNTPSNPGPLTLAPFSYEALGVFREEIITALRPGVRIGYGPAATAVGPSVALTAFSFVRTSVTEKVEYVRCCPDLS